jgi:uncharacterized protein YneR
MTNEEEDRTPFQINEEELWYYYQSLLQIGHNLAYDIALSVFLLFDDA